MHNLVVGDGVEEVVVARVEHRVAHAAEDSKHGSTAVLDLNIEGTVTGINILDLSGVASRDERRGAVVASGEVLGSSGVLAGGHGDSLGKGAEESDLYGGRPVRLMNREEEVRRGTSTHLGKSEGRNLGKSRETHAIIKDGRERNISGQVEGSREGDAELLDHHTDEGGLQVSWKTQEKFRTEVADMRIRPMNQSKSWQIRASFFFLGNSQWQYVRA